MNIKYPILAPIIPMVKEILNNELNLRTTPLVPNSFVYFQQ